MEMSKTCDCCGRPGTRFIAQVPRWPITREEARVERTHACLSCHKKGKTVKQKKTTTKVTTSVDHARVG